MHHGVEVAPVKVAPVKVAPVDIGPVDIGPGHPGTDRRHGDEFPWLDQQLPVLRRADSELQLGLEPERGLIISGVSVAFDPLLRLMDGTRSRAEIRAAGRANGVDSTLVDSVLDTILRSLGALGLAGEQAPEQRRLDSTIRLIGAGRIGREIGGALLAAGIARLEVSDPGEVDPTLYPGHPLAGTQAEALRVDLLPAPRPRNGAHRTVSTIARADRGVDRVTIGPHWSRIASGSASDLSGDPARRSLLTVVSAETTEIDRAVTDVLLRADQPHLVVRPWLGGVLIGPLVVPGLSPCLSCLDLTRTGTDPAWPQLLAQLIRRPDRSDPTTLSWAASTTTAQVLRWLRTGGAELLGGTLELRPPDYLLRPRRWDMHPGCGCSWPVTANWGA